MASLPRMTRATLRSQAPALPRPPRMPMPARAAQAGANPPSMPPRAVPGASQPSQPRQFAQATPAATPAQLPPLGPLGRRPNPHSLPPQFPAQLPPLQGIEDKLQRVPGEPPPSLSEQQAKEAGENGQQGQPGADVEFTDNGLQPGQEGQAGEGQGQEGQQGQGQGGQGQGGGTGSDAQSFLPTATPSTPSYDSLFPKAPPKASTQRGPAQRRGPLDRDQPPEAPKVSARGSGNAERRYREMQVVHRGLIDRVSGELKNLFETDRRPRHVGPFRSGRLDMKRYRQSEMRAAQGARRDDKVCVKRLQPMERDVEVVFCLDVSGSMQGANINAAEQALVVLCETLRELKVRYSILTFNYNTQVIKSSESEDPQGGALLDQIAIGGGTNDQEARKVAARILTHSDAQQRLMFFLTDGEGQDRRSQRLAVAALEEELPELTVLGIGIGDGCQGVAESYPHSVVVPKLGDLPTVLIDALQSAIDDR